MTAGFIHKKDKCSKKVSVLDRLMMDTNAVCTLTYAIDNLSNLSNSEITDIIEAVEYGKESQDAQVKEVIEKLFQEIHSLKLSKKNPLQQVVLEYNN